MAHTNGQSVLVHCEQGKSRSASIVIAYLILYHKYSFQNALQHVKKSRDIASPNIGNYIQFIYI